MLFASLSCVSHSIDICTVAIKNIGNMHAVLTNRIADILQSNDNKMYSLCQWKQLKQILTKILLFVSVVQTFES